MTVSGNQGAAASLPTASAEEGTMNGGMSGRP